MVMALRRVQRQPNGSYALVHGYVRAGETFRIAMDIDRNPGFHGMNFSIVHDATRIAPLANNGAHVRYAPPEGRASNGMGPAGSMRFSINSTEVHNLHATWRTMTVEYRALVNLAPGDFTGELVHLDRMDASINIGLPDGRRTTGRRTFDIQWGLGGRFANFTDIPSGAWFASSVQYVRANNLMSGMVETAFEPHTSITRAQVAAILWNMADSPATTFVPRFSDVHANNWFARQVTWANQVGIVAGLGDGTFAPNDPVTREQFAVMMRNFARFMEQQGRGRFTESDGTAGAWNSFPDRNSTSSWAVNSLRWANSHGFITGMDDGTIAPRGTTTRAQAASILMRMHRAMG